MVGARRVGEIVSIERIYQTGIPRWEERNPMGRVCPNCGGDLCVSWNIVNNEVIPHDAECTKCKKTFKYSPQSLPVASWLRLILQRICRAIKKSVQDFMNPPSYWREQ